MADDYSPLSDYVSVMRPGPTVTRAMELRKRRGTEGLAEAIAEPLMFAPGALGLVGGAIGAVPYLTGEKTPESGARALSDVVTNLIATRVPEPLRNVINPTVRAAKRIAYPEIYSSPKELVAGAAEAARTAPEDPLMRRLFGVTREDLYQLGERGARAGNIEERPFVAASKAKGAKVARDVMTPENERRLQDIIGEAQKYPELYKGMSSWYVMDPLYKRFEDIYGKELAPEAYRRFNTLTGMSSPGSDVLTEINRGTAAYWLANKDRFADFVKHGGGTSKTVPEDMEAVMGHMYHKTAHAVPMEKYLRSGELEMDSAKVPSYIAASGVPEVGFQTAWPVGDAHWARLVGLPDVRGTRTRKGKEILPDASASVPEMVSLAPWFREKIAVPMQLEAVPAQAIIWGAGSRATGVESPVGAPKLELLARQIGRASERMGVSPETARDLIIRGEAHAGKISPEVAAALAGGSGLTAYVLSDFEEKARGGLTKIKEASCR